MASLIVFELEDPETEALRERRFEAIGIAGDDLWETLGGENGAFFDFIEEIEQEVGTIDQTGAQDRDGTEWTIGSSEIEDQDAFVTRVTDKVVELTGWTLVERT